MVPGEIAGDFEQYIRAALFKWQSGIWTAMPAIVNKWNYPTTSQNTVAIVPAIQGLKQQDDGTWISQPMPQHDDVPVHYLGGGGTNGFWMTHPISQGDEGILVYASRALDGFWQNGGVQPRPDYAQFRMHDLSDAMFIPSRLSDKKKLVNINQTKAQLRSLDGTSFFEMLPSGGGFRFVTPGGTTVIDGAGNITTTGEITRGQGTGDQVTLGKHKHTQPNDSNGDTEAQTNSPTAGT